MSTLSEIYILIQVFRYVQISVACPKSTQFIPFPVSKVAMSEVLQILIFFHLQDVSGSDAPIFTTLLRPSQG